jgi:hypothetical protein
VTRWVYKIVASNSLVLVLGWGLLLFAPTSKNISSLYAPACICMSGECRLWLSEFI